MSTISLSAFSVGAPGTFITEGASSAQGTPNITTHNSVYLLVEAPSEAPVTVFQENTPITIFSVNDYLNLIGGAVPVGGSELLSYYNVRTFFENAQGGALTVVRVGQPNQVQRLVFKASGLKDNGVSTPSELKAGDVVYFQVKLNGQSLGETNSLGQYLGVPVTIPTDYILGDITGNLEITQEIANAIESAILADSLISASVYVRFNGSDLVDGTSYLDLTGRVLGQPILVVPESNPVANRFVFSTSTSEVQNLPVDQLPDQGPNDYIQTIRTAFDSTLPQGFLLAPPAFAKFDGEARAKIGAAMEAHCSSEDYKWVALIDPGPFNVADLVKYADLREHNPSAGFTKDYLYLINNVVYQWDDSSYKFLAANVDLADPDNSINQNLDPGFDNRIAIADSATFDIVGITAGTNVLQLDKDWPVASPGYGSGIRISLVQSGVVGLDNGTYFVIASDVDGTLGTNEIKLALTQANALADSPVNIENGGTNIGVISYADPVYDVSVNINGVESSVLEALTSGQAFNGAYLPGSLQKPTEYTNFRTVARRILDASTAILNLANVSTFNVINHGLVSGDIIYFNTDITAGASGTIFSATTNAIKVPYYVQRITDDSFVLAVSSSALTNNQFVPFPANPFDATASDFWSPIKYESDNNLLGIYNEIRWIRGRKYALDYNIAEFPLLDDTGAAVLNNIVTIRFSEILAPADENDFVFTYLTQADATPNNNTTNYPAGTDVFFNVPTQQDDTSSGIYVVATIEDTTIAPQVATPFAGSQLRIVYTPEVEPPSTIWNFKAIDSTALIDEALRGINNSGIPQAITIDRGIDSHNAIIEDGLSYSTTQGFLAYYAPYIRNEFDAWVSPTPFAAGVAVRRQRSEGFQYPPAGIKYRLRGAVEAQVKISSVEQDVSNPLGINALRNLPGYPTTDIYIWGGRTRVNRNDATQKLYQFVNTRVILNVIFGSLRNAFDSEIFSVIDGQNVLFTKIKAITESLLYTLFAGGALFGAQPRDAYSVICDRRNNPAALLEDGIVQVSVYCVPVPTLERIQLELIRVPIDGIQPALAADGFESSTNSFVL